MKKVLVISSSLRHGSNSEALAEEFARGAREAGNDVELITLRGKDIKFCIGCLSCQKTQKCVIKDDAPAIVAKMHDADVICFASPIYYYEMGVSSRRCSTEAIRFIRPITVSATYICLQVLLKMRNRPPKELSQVLPAG